jgi:hypothetical protein
MKHTVQVIIGSMRIFGFGSQFRVNTKAHVFLKSHMLPVAAKFIGILSWEARSTRHKVADCPNQLRRGQGMLSNLVQPALDVRRQLT